MKYGDSRVDNSHITVSSNYSDRFLPAHGRLDCPGMGKKRAAWVARPS